MIELSIFSAPKPFEGHIETIQRNAIWSWIELGGSVEVLLLGDEIGLEQTAGELGAHWITVRDRSPQGTPLLNSVFSRAADAANSKTMCYVNADIILFGDLLKAIEDARAAGERFLLLGQRWDLAVESQIDFASGWEDGLRREVRHRGRRHRRTGSDFFAYPKPSFASIPPFALGRAGWDNWMIYDARRRGIPVIDASQTVTVVHQDHDYSHLPGGQPHYRLPESAENVRLAGGKRHMFTLDDADWMLVSDGEGGSLIRRSATLRSLEAGIYLRARSALVAELTFVLFHPLRAFGELLGKIRSGLWRIAGRIQSSGMVQSR